jgi:hypothetical protein
VIYELRTYFALPGKWDELLAQFRDHLFAIFEDHGISSHGYWADLDRESVLIYLVSHAGDPEENWNSFRADSRWIPIRDGSSTGGQLISSIESLRLSATEFSALH